MRRVTKAIALPALFLIVLAGSADDQDQPAKQEHDTSSFRIAVDVTLVVLHATVTDRQGGFVSDLTEKDFQVYEDGRPQPIRLFLNEDLPVTAGLVVDHSTTMIPKMAEVSAATRTFVRASNREDEMFVVNFNEKVSLGLPPSMRFTDSASQLQRAIANAPAQGQTALYDAIARALNELQAGSRDRKVLIVISDGGDNASAHTLPQVMKLAAQSSAVIYTVGLFDEGDPDRNPAVLKSMAQATGGEAFIPGQLSGVEEICERIARDIRHQYTLGYVPIKPAREGAYHAIRVHAQTKGHDKLSVRTRTGYVAGAVPPPAGRGAK
jgi:VWFA-related protein